MMSDGFGEVSVARCCDVLGGALWKVCFRYLGNVWRKVFNVQGVQFDYFSFESTLVSTSELVSSSNSNSAKTESLGKNSKRCC